jgi:hypothetical protein
MARLSPHAKPESLNVFILFSSQLELVLIKIAISSKGTAGRANSVTLLTNIETRPFRIIRNIFGKLMGPVDSVA